MTVLVVNNGATEPTALERSFPGAALCGWDMIDTIDPRQYALIVLSGSSGFPVVGNEHVLESEFNLIRTSPVPIVGICYGFEIIVAAFGGTLSMLPEKEKGVRELEILERDPVFEGIEKLTVYEGHRWGTERAPEPLVPLARSVHGIEAVRYVGRPLYGFQFHPEKHLEETVGARIIANIQALFLG